MPLNVYYSLSPFGTGDIKVACNMFISGGAGVSTFSVAQTGNIGVGDHVISANINGFISEMTSSTSAKIVTALGVAHGNVSSEALTSIGHEYASLSAFEAGFTDANHINDTDLTNADVIANAPCYYDHDDQTEDDSKTLIQLPNVTDTDVSRFIKVYTPQGGTESINNQRHNGKRYNSSIGYAIRYTGALGIYSLALDQPYTLIDGLQLELSNTSSTNKEVVRISDTQGGSTRSSGCVVKNCIVGPSPNAGAGENNGFSVGGINSSPSPSPVLINCIAYGLGAAGIKIDSNSSALNCTSYGNDIGFDEGAGSNIVINCVSAGNTTTEFDIGWNVASDFNAADDTSAPGTNSVDNITPANEFVSLTGDAEDFSVKDLNADIYNAGTDLSGSGVTDDIIGTARPQDASYDIGAFEFISGVVIPVMNAHYRQQLQQ